MSFSRISYMIYVPLQISCRVPLRFLAGNCPPPPPPPLWTKPVFLEEELDILAHTSSKKSESQNTGNFNQYHSQRCHDILTNDVRQYSLLCIGYQKIFPGFFDFFSYEKLKKLHEIDFSGFPEKKNLDFFPAKFVQPFGRRLHTNKQTNKHPNTNDDNHFTHLTNTHTHTQTYTYTYTNIHIHVRIHTYTHTNKHTCRHTHTHTHTHTDTHTLRGKFNNLSG